MRSGMPRVLMRLLPMACAMPVLPGCAAAPPIVATPAACSTLIPDSWRQGVPGAALPVGGVVGDWIAFADAQTGQLDKANGRTADTLAIIERCEARDRAAVKRAG